MSSHQTKSKEGCSHQSDATGLIAYQARFYFQAHVLITLALGLQRIDLSHLLVTTGLKAVKVTLRTVRSRDKMSSS